MSGLFHYVAELSGECQTASAFHRRRFDEQHIAADGCPCQARSDSDLISLEQLFLKDFRTSQELVQIVGMDFPDLFFTNGNLLGNLPADGGDFAFQISQSRLLCVQVDDGADTLVGKLDLSFL